MGVARRLQLEASLWLPNTKIGTSSMVMVDLLAKPCDDTYPQLSALLNDCKYLLAAAGSDRDDA